MLRRDLCSALLAAAAAPRAFAQEIPSKPIRIAVGFPPGGSADTVARIVQPKFAEFIGRTVVVENRPGATGSIVADQIARGEADGSRVMMLPSSTFLHGLLSSSVPYNISKDFTNIAYGADNPLVLVVRPTLEAKSVAELLQMARSKPGALTFGSDGVGGSTHLAGELFAQMAGVKLTHIPFKSNTETTTAAAAGTIDMTFPSLPSTMPLLRAERYRALAVTTLKRSSLLPNVPTLDESGLKGYEQKSWHAFLGPVGMHPDVVSKLRVAFNRAFEDPEVKENLGKVGIEAHAYTDEQIRAFMADATTKIRALQKQLNLKME